eukprot:COSAG01_NODE_4480_length_4985_cov_15.664142_7_plen_30_part_00
MEARATPTLVAVNERGYEGILQPRIVTPA